MQIASFCKEFNARTQKDNGLIIPVVITVYSRPLLHLHHKDSTGCGSDQESNRPQDYEKAGAGSPRPNKEKWARSRKLNFAKLAEQKIQDMNAASVETAMKSLAGTARSMGVDVRLD